MADPSTPLTPGIREQLLTLALERQLGEGGATLDDLDPGEAHAAIAQYLEHLLAASLSTIRGKDRAERQRRLAGRVIEALEAELGPEWNRGYDLADPLRRLLAVHGEGGARSAARPDTPLARSALLTGTRVDPSLASQLAAEIAHADRVDILVSFIKWGGTRLLLDALQNLTSTPHPDGPRLRIISTSYMGATDPKAIEALAALPNTEVRVSYDTKRTRLHAKGYIVHRATGFGSAYVGSANLSHAAMTEGLEWTTKVSQYELPHLWQKIIGTFESHWHEPEFEAFDEAQAPRLREAIRREQGGGQNGASGLPNLDLRPFPFQEEILEALAAEREASGKNRQLVVAATGTGKTMIAAFDYRRIAQHAGTRPPLLFIAHRREILEQALATFRVVLRDQNFGDLLVGGREPEQQRHLFCSIQSYNSRGLHALAPDHFRYVVVDEFHHAEASSYKRLLDHVEPKHLLGLTATPERGDGLDVLKHFGGEATAEIRLPDAIDRRLLSPFQYFGVSDSEDLSQLEWKRGGYRVEDLDRVYTGNDARASLVLDKVHEIVLSPERARGLGFCVSIAHANFMARYFNGHGLPSMALSAESTQDERDAAKRKLANREVNFIFVVDLYNEGVDIPEIDTVLFLRPTESLTVYLQQLGRGLRLHDEKDCLTVLDFIGAQRREFRFASRFRALSTNPTGRLEKEIEAGFPHLPAGCSVQLERIAKQRVLDNVRQTLKLQRPRMVGDIRELGRHLGRPPVIREALEYLDTTLDELLKRGLWSRLLVDAGLAERFTEPDEEQLARGIRRLAHVDDPRQIRFLLAALDGNASDDPLARQRLTMLHLSLWGPSGVSMSLAGAGQKLSDNPRAIGDLREVLRHRLSHTRTREGDLAPDLTGPLSPHAHYTRDEALVGLGHWTMDNRPDLREGTLHLKHKKLDAFFVTLHKTEEHYSPTTMYDDYAISDRLFHWQSQSTTSADSPTGQRYIHHRAQGSTPLLFVRERRALPSGLTAPYAFLGPVDYVSHEGSRPISITWRLRTPMPANLLRQTSSAIR